MWGIVVLFLFISSVSACRTTDTQPPSNTPKTNSYKKQPTPPLVQAAPAGDTAPLNLDLCPGLELEQKSSFLAPVPQTTTLRIQIDSRFSDSEQVPIRDAIETWNRFSAYKGHALILAPRSSTPPDKTQDPGGVASCSFRRGFEGPGFWIIKEQGLDHWQQYGLSHLNPAVTLRCSSNGMLTEQVILVNSDYAHPMQVESILLHELGHALGLDHSCNSEGANRAQFLSCHEAAIQRRVPYLEAVMYPFLRSGLSPEIKEALQLNDEVRAECLFHR